MTCSEHTQMDISALIDGELGDENLLPLIDLLARNEECRTFYLDARSLDESVAGMKAPKKLPERIWRTIRSRAGADKTPASLSADTPTKPSLQTNAATKSRSIFAMPKFASAWAMGAAAVCVLTLVLWDTPSTTDPEQTTRHRPGVRIELELASDPDQMSDERFVSLMAELLQADTKYHRKMLEVMSEVDGYGFQAEGSSEGRGIPAEESQSREQNSANTEQDTRSIGDATIQ